MQHLLTILILLPTIGAIAAVGHSLASYGKETHYRWIALGFSLVNSVLSLFLLQGSGSGAWSFEYNTPWINAVHANYHVGVDGISLWLVLLTTLLVPIS